MPVAIVAMEDGVVTGVKEHDAVSYTRPLCIIFFNPFSSNKDANASRQSVFNWSMVIFTINRGTSSDACISADVNAAISMAIYLFTMILINNLYRFSMKISKKTNSLSAKRMPEVEFHQHRFVKNFLRNPMHSM